MQINVKYVSRHPITGQLRYRRRVPEHLRELIGKREIVKALKTQDPHEAAKRAQAINKAVERDWLRLLPRDDESDREAFERVLKTLELNDYKGENDPAALNPDKAREAQADAILSKYETKLGREPQPSDLAKDDLYNVQLLVNDNAKPPALSIRDALRIYLDEKGQGKRNRVEQHRFKQERARIVGSLVAVIGDKPVEEVTRADARRYRKHLTENLGSVASVNKYLRILSAIFNVVIKEYELNRQNPFAEMTLQDPVPKKEKRKSFTHKQLQQIVKAANAPSASGRGSASLRRDLKDILLLLLDTGARLNEIVGLTREDVVLTGKTPHILIRPNSVRHLKTANSKRRVPLIGHALAAAREACQTGRKGGREDAALFPRYATGRGNTVASSALNKFLRTRAKVKEEGRTLHSLRHTFKDRMRNAGIAADVADVIQGHSNDNVSGDYGEGYSLEYLKRELDKVKRIEFAVR